MGRITEIEELRNLKLELDRETDRLNGLINRVSMFGGSDSEKVDGGGLNSTEDKYINILDLLHKQEIIVRYLSNKYYTLENEIFEKIRKVSEKNQLFGFILYEKFIKLTSAEKISRKIHYCRSKYFMLQEEAIKIYKQI